MLGIAITANGIERETIERCYRALADARISIPYRVRISRSQMSPFNLSKARNTTILDLLPHCDRIICMDADLLVPPGLIEHVAGILQPAHATWGVVRNIDQFSGIYRWDDWKSLPLRKTGLGAFVGMSTADWLLLGGWDERLENWGGEDNVLALRRKEAGVQTHEVTEFPLVHVNHPWRAAFGTRRGHENVRHGTTQPPKNWLTGRLQIPANANHLHLFVTTDCQATCSRCNQQFFMKAHPGYHMSLDDIDALLRATKESGYVPFQDVIISGGEPLLWRHLEAAVELLHEARIGALRVFTNAIAAEGIPESVMSRVSQFRVSVYDWNRQQAESLQRRCGKKAWLVNRENHYVVPRGKYGSDTLPAKCGGQGCVMYDGRIYPCCNAISTPGHLGESAGAAPSCAVQPGYRELTLFNLRRMDELCRGCIGNANVQQWLRCN